MGEKRSWQTCGLIAVSSVVRSHENSAQKPARGAQNYLLAKTSGGFWTFSYSSSNFGRVRKLFFQTKKSLIVLSLHKGNFYPPRQTKIKCFSKTKCPTFFTKVGRSHFYAIGNCVISTLPFFIVLSKRSSDRQATSCGRCPLFTVRDHRDGILRNNPRNICRRSCCRGGDLRYSCAYRGCCSQFRSRSSRYWSSGRQRVPDW